MIPDCPARIGLAVDVDKEEDELELNLVMYRDWRIFTPHGAL